jgi:hypothetical protein
MSISIECHFKSFPPVIILLLLGSGTQYKDVWTIDLATFQQSSEVIVVSQYMQDGNKFYSHNGT